MSARAAPVYGLILAGGSSSRMQRDKAALKYQGKSQLDRAFELAEPACRARCSCRCAPIKPRDPTRAQRPDDRGFGRGRRSDRRHPLGARRAPGGCLAGAGLRSAVSFAMPRSSQLLRERDPSAAWPRPIAAPMTACPSRCARSGSPRPPPALAAYQAAGGHCPRKFLMRHARASARAAGPTRARQRQYSRGICTGACALDAKPQPPCNSKSSTTP